MYLFVIIVYACMQLSRNKFTCVGPGLEKEFNSLDAQREACEAYIASQRHEGWILLPQMYDDGGFTGGNMERPALQRLLKDIQDGKVDACVVYKVDRLSRSLLDFAKIIEMFETNGVAFTSITQAFNTTTSMGRLTLNILLSFSQFEREIIGERIRDKVAAAKRKGKFTGGTPPLGYDVDSDKHKLLVNDKEAKVVKFVFKRFTETASGLTIARELNAKGITTKTWLTKKGIFRPGNKWNATHIYRMLSNKTYLGETKHREATYPGEHEAIITKQLWEQVHDILANHKRADQPSVSKVPALLRGIIRCGHCDRAMTNAYTEKNGRVYRYYVCTRAAKSGYDVCPVKSIPAGTIEEAVLNQLHAVFRSPEMIAQTFHAAKKLENELIGQLKSERSELELQILRMRQRVSEMVAAIDMVSDESSEFVVLNNDLNSARNRHQQICAELMVLESDTVAEQTVSDALIRIETIWNDLFPYEHRRIVQLIVEGVTVNVDTLDVRIRSNGLHSLLTEVNGAITNHPQRSCT